MRPYVRATTSVAGKTSVVTRSGRAWGADVSRGVAVPLWLAMGGGIVALHNSRSAVTLENKTKQIVAFPVGRVLWSG